MVRPEEPVRTWKPDKTAVSVAGYEQVGSELAVSFVEGIAVGEQNPERVALVRIKLGG
ncbi:hypothetical protein SDC9_200371 [bioreactor metagenome]|uniref:Uncharacterized protein n=1 Tax=bioreactor metagenome TaxID=1076179 RepID=A0A645IQU9_9ZZZZ